MQLRYQNSAQEIYEALKAIPRTGWVMRNVPNPETVYDHTRSLIMLAHTLRDELALTDAELDDLTHILEVHDWAEATAGDEYIPNEDTASYEERKIQKHKRERDALTALLQDKPYKSEVMALWERYEEGSDPIAKLAKELDKFQALALAATYEERYEIPLFREFDEYYTREQSFTHPVIIEKISDLRSKHEDK